MKIIACNSSKSLSEKISEHIGMPLADASLRTFNDREIFVEINENIRGEDVFIIQSTSHPANDHLMELLITIDAARRGSAKRITAVIPYYGYARQDRKTGPRTPITAKLVANLVTSAGAHRVLTMDLHAGQIQGFFDIPLDNIFSAPPILKDIKEKFAGNKDIVVASPDVGGVVRARALAKYMGDTDLAIIDKRREKANESEVMNVIGDVKKKTCIIIDDIIDTAGTLCNAADALKKQGAQKVYAYISHPVLSGSAIEKISKSKLDSLIVTDTIPLSKEAENCKKIKIVSMDSTLAGAITRVNREESISEMFL